MKNFPFSKQHDAMQCGIACLQMICKFYGKEYSLESLSERCSANAEGVSLLGISESAGELGLHTTCGKVSLEQLQKVQLPCILYWEQNHFVVLYKIKTHRGKRRYYVADPGRQLLIYQEDDFCQSWISFMTNGEEKGVVLLLNPTPTFYQKEGERITKKHSFRRLFGYLKQYKSFLIQVMLGLLVGSLLLLIAPFLTQAIVDLGIVHQNMRLIYLILLAQLVLTISRASVDFIRSWILLHISMRINISLVSDFFVKLLKLPMSFFDTKLTGDLLQRMSDHERVEKFLTTQTLSILFSLLSFVVFGAVLLAYNLMIFGVYIGGTILYGIWIILFLEKRKQLDYLYFAKQSENKNKTYQFVVNMREIKLQDCEQRRRWEWENIQADLFEVKMKNMRFQQVQEAGSLLINEIKNIIITVLAAYAVIEGQMTLGMMLAISYIIGQLNVPVEQLLVFIYSYQDVKIGLERINEIHEMGDESDKYGDKKKFDNNKSICLNGIGFKYNLHSPQKTLDDIRFIIPEGKVTAIVGTSGSGKTTLIKLLLGYYKPLEGDIQVGGTSMNDFNMKWWRRQCGVVMQDGVIFSESIARNIAVDDADIDLERLAEAARIANIEQDILRLPLKYNTTIGQDGVGLSQGQKQRILIARAVYKNPQFIFLDEATNSLDANNEKAIVENLNQFYKGRTVVVVAHRLSTVKDADQIIVIDKGRIIEVGCHDMLVKEQGAYYHLVRNQIALGN